MKSTGIIRKVDNLGRIVLPMELRKVLKFEGQDMLEIYVEDGMVVLKKYKEESSSPGIVRKMDNLGRAVIPMEVRQTLEISIGDPLAIYTDNDTIIMKKYEPICVFCRSTENITIFMKKSVCKECITTLCSQHE